MEDSADPNLQDDTMRELYEASLNGCVSTLSTLIQRDPLILSRVSLYPFTETPLHIASLLGHLEFCKVLLDINPCLGSEVNAEGRCPLHLASAKGHTEVVKALLLTNPETCMVRDKDDMLPLHFAAMRGRLGAIEELTSANPESTREMTTETHAGSILHLCIRYNHLEALKFLVELESVRGDNQFLCAKDKEGNTILHLAVRRRQIKTIKYLLSLSQMGPALNALNRAGLTALDMSEPYRRDFISPAIEQILTEAGVQRSADMIIAQQGASSLTLNIEQQLDQSQTQSQRISEQQLTPSQTLATEQNPVPLLSMSTTQQEEPSTNIDIARPSPSSSSIDNGQQPPLSGSIDTAPSPLPLSSMDPLEQQPSPLSSIDHAPPPPPPPPPPLPAHSSSIELVQQQPFPSSGTDLAQPSPTPEGVDHAQRSSSSIGPPQQPPPSQSNNPPAQPSPSQIERFCKTYLISHRNWLKANNKQLMVAATVIATMTFQSVISPPGGVWQADTPDGHECTKYGGCGVGTAVVGYPWPSAYTKFIFFNSASFFSSLCVVLIIISGFPLDNKVIMWILTFFMAAAFTGMLFTYMWALGLTTPLHIFYRIHHLKYILIGTWLLLLLLICLIQVIRFIFWVRSKPKPTTLATAQGGRMEQLHIQMLAPRSDV